MMTQRSIRTSPAALDTPCYRCPKNQSCAIFELVNVSVDRLSSPVIFSRYQPGRYISRQDEPAVGLYVVCRGLVMVSSMHERGHEYGLDLVGVGGVLHATDNVLRENCYTVSTKVLTDATIAFLRVNDFAKSMRDSSSFATKLTQQVCHQTKQLKERYGYLASESVCQRMMYLLSSLADLAGQPSVDGLVFPMRLDRSDLAVLLATTPETISRLSARLQRSGLVRLESSRIILPDPERLKRATCCDA